MPEYRVTTLMKRTLESTDKVVVHKGGAGSGKSWAVAQTLIYKLTNETDKSFGICRKTFPALKMTAYNLFTELLRQYGLYSSSCENKSDHTYRFNGNVIYFFSLDDPEKIKSAEFNYLWLEEANEFTYEDYIILKLRLRRHTERERNQMYLSFNPVDGNGWIAQRLVKEEDVEVIHSTHKDNQFLDEDSRKVITSLIDQDMNYYRVYCLGEWGSLENLIYPRYEVVDDVPAKIDAWAYGLDFGFVNPTALVAVFLCDGKRYIREKIYEPKLANDRLIEKLGHFERAEIYADHSRPEHIDQILKSGFPTYEANKDVQFGINLVKQHFIYVTKESVNIIKEIQGYQHRVDRNGTVLEEPVKFNDHAMDAMRYAIVGLTQRFGYSTSQIGTRKVKVKYW